MFTFCESMLGMVVDVERQALLPAFPAYIIRLGILGLWTMRPTFDDFLDYLVPNNVMTLDLIMFQYDGYPPYLDLGTSGATIRRVIGLTGGLSIVSPGRMIPRGKAPSPNFVPGGSLASLITISTVFPRTLTTTAELHGKAVIQIGDIGRAGAWGGGWGRFDLRVIWQEPGFLAWREANEIQS
jgi:hypothetical protein